METLEEQVEEIIKEICPEKLAKFLEERELKEDTDLLEELELDSVDIVTLITQLEERFGVVFQDEDMMSPDFYCFGFLCQAIRK